MFVVLFNLIISGCSSTLSNDNATSQKQENNIQTPAERATQLLNLTHWKINGKIAFISPDNKESAGLAWTVNEKNNSQQLNLNTYLGINVLDLTSENSKHTIKVDGEEYISNNLSELINSLTGLTLPTKALNFWLKGLPYQKDDQIQFDKKTQLPTHLTSFYQGDKWDISYQHYKPVGQFQLATKFSIKKDNLLIKIAIRKWQVLD